MRAPNTTKALPLDMAANTFLCMRTRKWNYVIRMGYLLKEKIDPARLRRAVEDIYPRFPSFFVTARRGFTNYKLVCMEYTDVVRREMEYPCSPFDLFSRAVPVIRVVYNDGCRFRWKSPIWWPTGKRCRYLHALCWRAISSWGG